MPVFCVASRPNARTITRSLTVRFAPVGSAPSGAGYGFAASKSTLEKACRAAWWQSPSRSSSVKGIP